MQCICGKVIDRYRSVVLKRGRMKSFYCSRECASEALCGKVAEKASRKSITCPYCGQGGIMGVQCSGCGYREGDDNG